MQRLVVVLFALSLLLLGGCASIVSGSKQEVSFQSTPDNATVTVGGRVLGKTPMAMQLDKKSGQMVVFNKDGYKPAVADLTTDVDPWFFGNIILGGFIGSTVDGLSGAIHKYAPNQYHVTLEKADASIYDKETGKEQQVKIKEFIILRHAPLMADIQKGGGENSAALFTLLKIPNDQQEGAVRKVRALSEVFADPPKFADEVIAVLYSPPPVDAPK